MEFKEIITWALKDFVKYKRRRILTEEIINNQTIGLVYTISHCSYTGTSVSYPIAIVTDLSKAEEIKKSIINKYGDCETYYFHINALEPVTEEEMKNLEELKERRGEFNAKHWILRRIP